MVPLYDDIGGALRPYCGGKHPRDMAPQRERTVLKVITCRKTVKNNYSERAVEMKFKNLIILLAVFIVLVGIVFVKKGMEPTVPTTEEMADIITSSLNLENLSEAVFRFGLPTRQPRTHTHKRHFNLNQ